jgi:hypothetical protein
MATNGTQYGEGEGTYSPSLKWYGRMNKRTGQYTAAKMRNPIRSFVVIAAAAGKVFFMLLKLGKIAPSIRAIAWPP